MHYLNSLAFFFIKKKKCALLFAVSPYGSETKKESWLTKSVETESIMGKVELGGVEYTFKVKGDDATSFESFGRVVKGLHWE